MPEKNLDLLEQGPHGIFGQWWRFYCSIVHHHHQVELELQLRSYNLLKNFRKTQRKLIRLMNTSIASLPSLNVGFMSLLGHKRLLNQHWKEREGEPRKCFNNYDRDRGVHAHSCIMGNQGKMAGNLKICTGIQSQLILPKFIHLPRSPWKE